MNSFNQSCRLTEMLRLRSRLQPIETESQPSKQAGDGKSRSQPDEWDPPKKTEFNAWLISSNLSDSKDIK